MSNALAIINGTIQEARNSFAAVLVDRSINFEREAGFALQILTGNDYAALIATENRQSVINAITNVAAIGISLNPAKRQAYLVPRDRRICLDISYMGLLDLAIQSGSILWGQAELVHESEKFELVGFDKPPVHNRNPFAKDRGPVVGAYVVVKTRDGDYLTACMSLEEVFAIRDRSSAWKAWVEKKKKCPWVTDEGEMTKKTVIKRAYKTWPKTERLENAVHFLNTEGGEGLDEVYGSGSLGPGVIKGTDGAMGRLSTDAQGYMRELAKEVEDMFNNPEFGVSIAFDKIEAENFDSDQKVALWSQLPSNVRAGLKKEGEARRKQAELAKQATDAAAKIPASEVPY